MKGKKKEKPSKTARRSEVETRLFEILGNVEPGLICKIIDAVDEYVIHDHVSFWNLSTIQNFKEDTTRYVQEWQNAVYTNGGVRLPRRQPWPRPAH